MDSGYMKVNFVAMQTAVDDLNRGVSQLTTGLSDLHNRNAPLVDTWSGEAKERYHERHLAWTDNADKLKELLQTIKKNLELSLQEYAQTEGSIAKSFGGAK